MTEIVTLASRPDLALTVASWIWQEWSRHDGFTLNQTLEYMKACPGENNIPQCFVLLDDGTPVGTSSLVQEDLVERTGLGPWMASVFVVPEARRKGHVIPLIQAVEAAAIAAGVRTLWLHTETAEQIYIKAGWQTAEVVQRHGKNGATVMRRDFA